MLECARLEFNEEGVPCSTRYGDIYHSRSGGVAQAQHVFLQGNQLPERWQDTEQFVILETGFGLGLNFLVTWATWRQTPGHCRRLHFVSLEKHPFEVSDLARALSGHPELQAFSLLYSQLIQQWPLPLPGIHRLHFDDGAVVLTLVFGDATQKLAQLELRANAFYLDGFSPQKNPELWDAPIIRTLARLAAPAATLATWSVSGRLRQLLSENEFSVQKQAGFGQKRTMLTACYLSRKPHPYPLPEPAQRHALVIGAGIAGSSIAHALASRKWQVEVLEQHAGPAQGASGNRVGLFRPHPSMDDNLLARLSRSGFLTVLRHLQQLSQNRANLDWGAPGALHLAKHEEQATLQAELVRRLALPEPFVRYLSVPEITERFGFSPRYGGLFFSQGGWVSPPSLCQANLNAFPEFLQVRYQCLVQDIAYQDGLWHALDAQGSILASAPHLVVAGGVDAPKMRPLAWLPQRPARGQTTLLPEQSIADPGTLVCGPAYLTSALKGFHVAGASLVMDDADSRLRPEEHAANLERLRTMLPGIIPELDANTLTGRVGFRPMSPDRLPMVGPVPDLNPQTGKRHAVISGLWCMQGFGTRGIVWSALMADMLASYMQGEPLPLEHDLLRSVSLFRFAKKILAS